MLSSDLNPPLERFALGPWQVNVSLDEVTAQGQVHKLEPRTTRLLTVLARAGGDLVPADTLQAAVWPKLVVTPSSLYDAVGQLRKILGPGHIATVARKGYRLVTPVQRHVGTAGAESLNPAPSHASHSAPPDALHVDLGPRSIAVLPFQVRGLPDSLSFLRESLTGALIAELSRQPGLVVVARGTMLTFSESHATQSMTKEVGARFVVEGVLELRAQTLHVSVQVVDGWHGTQTWADALELPVSAWYETAAVVVGRLARALQFELNDLATRLPAAAGDVDLRARALSAQAWVEMFARPQTRETNERAAVRAGEARELAPRLAQAWMCLAFCEWRAAVYDWNEDPAQGTITRALASIERAVELDPRDPDARYVMGLVTMHTGQLMRAEEALLHCLRLSSSYAPAHGLMGLLRTRRGFPAEAATHCNRAFALSPREPLRAIWHMANAMAALALHDDHGALEAAQRGMAVNPAYPNCYLVGAAAAQRLGTLTQAREWVTKLRERTAFRSLAAVRQKLTRTYEPAALGQLEELIDLLRDAGLPEA